MHLPQSWQIQNVEEKGKVKAISLRVKRFMDCSAGKAELVLT
jgi:hypothetical protein